MEFLQIEYVYQHSEEQDLEAFLTELQNEVGGERSPYYSRGGAIDLVAFFGVVVAFVIAPTLQSAAQKYLEGLLNLDELKNLGEGHRKQIFRWFQEIETRVYRLIRTIQAKQFLISRTFTFQQKEEALVLEVPTKFGTIYVVLNHKHISPTLLENLPRGIVAAIRYLHENSLLEEGIAFQLYFDVASQEWVYLFAPSIEGFSHYIDRYVDLRDQQIKQISSQSEFMRLFQPASEDEFKFLVSPFREYKEIANEVQVYTPPNNSGAAD
ncbi:hypothetical protein [Chroococcidiopsis sp. CCNUC1]|uniref:hypothetical protein n=1 Tax=Chroococcidiopsis sp. CCNUC1 TaxID=2653189 RepID=UPI00202152F8|nr:hypothetical protein [Chroococcidiopsis sp. CCNUC1]URD51261.1 hypothetical protein M5J74_04565 [Chroococcidiopsis sp. CCNUC1]